MYCMLIIVYNMYCMVIIVCSMQYAICIAVYSMGWFGLTNHFLSVLWARPELVRRIYAGNCQFIAQFPETNFRRFLTLGGFHMR